MTNRLKLGWFETFQSMTGPQDREVINFYNNFPILNAEAVLSDFKSFTYFIWSMDSYQGGI